MLMQRKETSLKLCPWPLSNYQTLVHIPESIKACCSCLATAARSSSITASAFHRSWSQLCRLADIPTKESCLSYNMWLGLTSTASMTYEPTFPYLQHLTGCRIHKWSPRSLIPVCKSRKPPMPGAGQAGLLFEAIKGDLSGNVHHLQNLQPWMILGVIAHWATIFKTLHFWSISEMEPKKLCLIFPLTNVLGCHFYIRIKWNNDVSILFS